MAAPQISPLPTPPSRSQSPETFSTDADVFLGALPEFQTDANAQADYLDALAIAVDADAASADADAAAAAASEAAAAASEAAAALSETNAAASEVAAAASESAAAISETNAAASEVAAAASAAEAEAIVAGIGFQDIVFINAAMSPYSITSATNGKLIACDTTGGNIVINLPQVSSLTLPFTTGTKKTTSDGNTVVINCTGSDTFDDGTTSKSVNVPAGFTLLPDIDTSPDVWVAIGFGGATAGPVTGSGLTMSTDKLLGRNTAGTGAIEEIAHASLAEMQVGTEVALRGMSPANIKQAITALGGNVSGPASATSSGIALYDGTSGKLLKSGLNNGTAGQVLTSAGDGVNPTWAALPPSGPTLQATLSGSGALADGSRVVVNPDGTVTPAQGATQLLGSAVVYSLYGNNNNDITYDTANQKVVVVYRDGDNIYYAAVGTVSGTDISFGTPVVIANQGGVGLSYCRVAYHAGAQKVVVIYTASGTYAKVGTVSGTSISFGAEASVPFGISQSGGGAIVYDSVNQKMVIVGNFSPNGGQATVGTVSGTSISFGTAVSSIFPYGSTNNVGVSLCFDPSTAKVVVVAQKYTGGAATAAVGTVSGTNISFGAENIFIASGTFQQSTLVYDPVNQKVVVVYKTNANGFATGAVATISDTSISFGTSTAMFSASAGSRMTSVYDAANNLIVLNTLNDSANGLACNFKINGAVTQGIDATIYNTNTSDASVAYDSIAQRIVFAYSNNTNSGKGTSRVFRNGSNASNVTAENFIGFSNGIYTTGQTATIQIVGSVDDAQSGLTAGQSYYVLQDGTLGLTPASPSVFAGTAVSATKIIVKG